MARAMHKVVGEAGVADHGACDVIHLGSCHRAVRPPALPQETDGGVSGLLHRLPHPADVRIGRAAREPHPRDRKSTRLNSSHLVISYAVFCLKKKKKKKKRKRY